MNKNETFEPEILVAGGGIAGCALAATLAKRGYDVLLAERAPAPRHIFKGEYLQPAAVQYLERVGFGSIFNTASSSKVTHLRFRDINEAGETTSSIIMGYPANQHARSIEFFDLLSGLTDGAKAILGERFWQGAELAPLSNEASSFAAKPAFTCKMSDGRTVTVRPRWVIGCDGRGSAVRRWIGGRLAAKNGRVTVGASEEFILGAHLREPTTVPDRYEVIRTAGYGTISAFALGAEGKRIYLSARPAEKGGERHAEAFMRALKQAKDAAGVRNIPESLPVTGYPANAEWFGPPANGRVFLAGDALAVTTPYGGQGMTIALQHARFLSEEINWRDDAAVTRGKHEYAEFASSAHERAALLNFGLYYAFFARPPIFKRSTQLIMRAWERNPELKSRVARLFGGLDRDTPTILEILDLERKPFGPSASRLLQRAFQTP